MLRKLSKETIQELLLQRRHQPLSYSEVNATLSFQCTKQQIGTDPCFDENENNNNNKSSSSSDEGSKPATKGYQFNDYNVDHHRVRLGRGEECYRAATKALREWKMFSLNWVELCFPDVNIEEGADVAILARILGMWSLNFCRIVYVIDECEEDGESLKFGFAYGTLAEHVETGEERFLIEWKRSDDEVWYDILSFSLPNHWLLRLGFSPVGRYFQHRFANQSALAMLDAVKSSAFVI